MTFFENTMDEIPAEALTAAETILVVDEYPALCNVAALFLGRCGYRVMTASNGEQAKQIANEHDIDLLLTDVEMPAVRGEELAAWFRATRPETQVVLMSGKTMQFHHLMPCHFVERPFVFLDNLVATIREVLNHGRAETPAFAAA
jgi:DNA-binding NtrC family response regulator